MVCFVRFLPFLFSFFRKQKLIICFFSRMLWRFFSSFQPMFFLSFCIYMAISVLVLHGSFNGQRKKFFGSLSLWVLHMYIYMLYVAHLQHLFNYCLFGWLVVVGDVFFFLRILQNPNKCLMAVQFSFHETSLNGQTDFIVYEYSKEVRDKRFQLSWIMYRNTNGEYLKMKMANRIRRICRIESEVIWPIHYDCCMADDH